VERYEGFREFVLARGPALSRTAYLLCGDHGAAEELVQSALARTVGRWRSVVAGGNPEGYVRRVMVNEHISWWRRLGRRERLVPEVPDGLASPGADAGLDRMYLSAAVARLAPRQRAVIVLRFYEDLSEAETAAILGCSVGTVKSQTYDALARLRQLVPVLRGADAEVAR
jgi:RNA polymerase sigma-70 factor (sigma-E family)